MEIILSMKKGNVSEEMAALNIGSDDAAIYSFIYQVYSCMAKLEREKSKSIRSATDIISDLDQQLASSSLSLHL